MTSRRKFIGTCGAVIGGLSAAEVCVQREIIAADTAIRPRLGLVTWMWGAEQTLDELIAICRDTDILGVELRTEHKHGVDLPMDVATRAQVKAKFSDSPVELVGLGTNFAFHSPKPEEVQRNITRAKEYVILSRDVGGSGVKVKPDALPTDVPREKTIEQIARSLDELGAFAADHGQQIRLEVHGGCAKWPAVAEIMAIAKNPAVTVCWNSNGDDLQGDGLEANLESVFKRFGNTAHIRPLDSPIYPTEKLLALLASRSWKGWTMIEDPKPPVDLREALRTQKRLFDAVFT